MFFFNPLEITPKLKCNNCEAIIEATHKFCPQCGQPASPSSPNVQNKPVFVKPNKVIGICEQSNAANVPPKPQARFYTPPQSPVHMDNVVNDEKPDLEGGDNEETWECKHCTFINTYDTNICAICSKTSWIQKPVKPAAQEQNMGNNKQAMNNTDFTDQKPVVKDQKPVVKEKPVVAPRNVQKQPSDSSKSNKGGWVRVTESFKT